MRTVRNPLAMTLAFAAAFAVVQGCGKSEKKDDGKKDDAGNHGQNGGGGGGGGGEADALLRDDYQGLYQLKSQVETPPFDGCDAPAESVKDDDFNKLPPYFKLDTVFEFTMEPQSEPKIDLWLYECSDEKTCQGQVMNFLFPEKTDGVWGGQTSLSISNSYFEPGKCSFGYTERTATLSGKDIVIVTNHYSGDVDPIGGGCMHDDGSADLYEYYAAYRGKIACDSRETV